MEEELSSPGLTGQGRRNIMLHPPHLDHPVKPDDDIPQGWASLTNYSGPCNRKESCPSTLRSIFRISRYTQGMTSPPLLSLPGLTGQSRKQRISIEVNKQMVFKSIRRRGQTTTRRIRLYKILIAGFG
jgi:hypothetical protein